jgi:hypothetical protein
VERLRNTVQNRDLAAFRTLMEQGRAYLSGRRLEALRRA